MQSLTHFLTVLADIGLSPLNIVLIMMVYFMGANSGVFPKFWKSEEETNLPTLKDLHKEMSLLRQYFNHDTTESLKIIKEDTQEIKKTAEKVYLKQEEWDKYGINVRKNV